MTQLLPSAADAAGPPACSVHQLPYVPLNLAVAVCPSCLQEDPKLVDQATRFAQELPTSGHLMIDALFAASESLQGISVDQSTEEGRVSTAAWWLKYLDERGFVLVRDPRKTPS